MAKVIYKCSSGETREVEVSVGHSVMIGAISNGIPGIEAECGGALSCATCHVYVDPQWLGRMPAIDSFENDLLENVAAERREGSRLSCQIVVTDKLDGLTVEIPESQNVIATYPIAVIKASKNRAAAEAFVDEIVTGTGQQALEARGFLPPS